MYQIDSQRAYVSNKDEETVYCIGQAGYALHGNDAHGGIVQPVMELI